MTILCCFVSHLPRYLTYFFINYYSLLMPPKKLN